MAAGEIAEACRGEHEDHERSARPDRATPGAARDERPARDEQAEGHDVEAPAEGGRAVTADVDPGPPEEIEMDCQHGEGAGHDEKPAPDLVRFTRRRVRSGRPSC